MHDAEEQSGFDSHVQPTIQDADAADDSEVQLVGVVEIVIGNTHLPAFILDGEVYVQAPLRHVFEAFAEELSDFIRDMEVRVSDARGTALSLDSVGRAVYGASMAKQGMGGGGE